MQEDAKVQDVVSSRAVLQEIEHYDVYDLTAVASPRCSGSLDRKSDTGFG